MTSDTAMLTSAPRPVDALSALVSEAQRLLEGPIIVKEVYVSWIAAAQAALQAYYGSESGVGKRLRSEGALPTNFFEASMAEVNVRLEAERRKRLANMKLTLEKWLAQPRGQAGNV